MHNSEKPDERNPDPSNIANLFQKNDHEGVCFHADMSREYSNKIFDKILLSAIKSQNSHLFRKCKEIVDAKRWDWGLKNDNSVYHKKWNECFNDNNKLLEGILDLNQESKVIENANNSKKVFRSDGSILMEGIFVNGDFVSGKLYHENSQLWMEGTFLNGMLNGKGKWYRDNGILWKEGEFLNGKLNGYGRIFDKNGNLYFEGEHVNGVIIRPGESALFIGNFLKVGVIVNGSLNGKGKYYRENGTLWMEGEFNNDELNGEGKMYREDGTLFCEGKFTNDELNGEGIEYHKNGKVRKQGVFLNGKLNGIGSVYREDGTLRYEGEFIDGELVENFNEHNEDDPTESSSRENDPPTINKTKDLSKEKDKDIQRENARKIKEKQKELEKIEKERERSFRIKYSIKLKKEISSQNMTGSILGTLFGYDKLKHVKSVQNEKGENIVRFIDIWHKGDKLPINIAKHYVQEKDTDVKNGRAGSSTIVIIEIKP